MNPRPLADHALPLASLGTSLAAWSAAPRQESRFLVQFTAASSPWWLLLLLPAVALLAWALYRRDVAALPRPARPGLTLLRAALLLALVFLAFRPNLVHRRTLTYPGRVAIVVDDSRSMGVRDDRLADRDALRLARSLGLPGADQAAPYHAVADLLLTLSAHVGRFERLTRQSDRGADAFWDQAARAQQAAELILDRVEQTSSAARPVTVSLASDAADRLARAQSLHQELRAGLPALFRGDRAPGGKSMAAYQRRAEEAALANLDLQARVDEARLAAGDAALRALADAPRGKSRAELAGLALARLAAHMPPALAGQDVQIIALASGERTPPGAPRADRESPGPTDLLGPLEALVQAPAEAPLAALVLVTDGQDVVGRSPSALTSALTRQQVALLAAMAGAPAEPTDLAIAQVVAPPIAVAGRPATIEVVLKAAVDRPVETRVEITRDDQLVVALPLKVSPAARVSAPLLFTPDQPGLFRYRVHLASVPGEVVPQANNAAEFVLHVRPEPLRVLLLDWKPRWQTRFALNVLQRLPYVDLNAIIAVTRDQQALARGAQRGAWPDSPAALEAYDLVILGDLPAGTLTDAEWDALAAWVENRGGSLCFLAPRSADGALPAAALQRGLLPVTPEPATTTRAAAPGAPAFDPTLRRADQLRLTPAGALHPLTQELADRLAVAPDAALAPLSGRLPPDARALLLGPDDQPLLLARPRGLGKSLLIDTDRLWFALNPTAHRAHLQLFVELATWSVEAAPPGPGVPLALERRRARAGQGLHVWAPAAQAGQRVEAVVSGQVVAQVPLLPDRPGSSALRAHFAALPPAAVAFRLAGQPALTPELLVTRHDRELIDLARRDALPDRLAAATGGARGSLADLPALLERVEPRERVERIERTWRLWDAPAVLALLVLVLSVEWVWRKLAGLV